MGHSLKQCTIRMETFTPNVEEMLSISKTIYWTPMRNIAKISSDNSIATFCKMVSVATELHYKSLYLHTHLNLWQVVYSLFFFM